MFAWRGVLPNSGPGGHSEALGRCLPCSRSAVAWRCSAVGDSDGPVGLVDGLVEGGQRHRGPGLLVGCSSHLWCAVTFGSQSSCRRDTSMSCGCSADLGHLPVLATERELKLKRVVSTIVPPVGLVRPSESSTQVIAAPNAGAHAPAGPPRPSAAPCRTARRARGSRRPPRPLRPAASW